MHSFPLCADCAREYEDPEDRRFHAQPVACPVCGPHIELLDSQGQKLDGLGLAQLEAGAVLAVKGLGGFQLVCDAHNREAVQRLREKKERGAKPFALMVRDIGQARAVVRMTEQEEAILQSAAAPIVVLPLAANSQMAGLAPEIAPGLHTLGVMLPYTPLHHLLFTGHDHFLVMTSANLSGQPLIYRNEEALEQLRGIADYFLLHDRDIYHPCDDSVVRVIGGQPVVMRRARGYVPLPLRCAQPVGKPLLAVGGELKNAFCLASGEKAFVSQYIGDMEEYENFRRFLQEVKSLQKIVHIQPELIACDAHPLYQTTSYAEEQKGYAQVKVQHHHAHLVSVMAEHDLREPCLGVLCDGTGYGADGKIWGFEFLYGDARGFERLAHLQYLPLPGGDAGTKFPLRIAYAYLRCLLAPAEFAETSGLWRGLPEQERAMLDQQLANNIRVFQTSSAGRLFDAVSALLGICTRVTYEGQAAIELESAAWRWLAREQAALEEQTTDQEAFVALIKKTALQPYAFELATADSTAPTTPATPRQILVKPLLQGIIQELRDGEDTGKISLRFHLTAAAMILETARQLPVGAGRLILNGGVFQNKLLTEWLLELCRQNQIEGLRARALPPGDGGIAFGQTMIANATLQEPSGIKR
jgi:hydrogenase maturation protein HypF